MGATAFVYFARVGDLVMLTPTLRGLADQGHLELVARPWAGGLLGHEGWLRGIHGLTKPNVPVWHDWLIGASRRALGQRLAGRFQRIVIFDREFPVVRQWIDSWRGQADVQVLPLSAQSADLHLIDANLAAAGLVTGAVPRLTVPGDRVAAARRRLDAVGRRVVAVQAGSSLTHRWFRKQANLKGLAPRQWATLLAGILAEGEADGVVLLGSAPEGREARAIREALPAEAKGRVMDWTGQVSLVDLPAVLSACVACVSVDTGPAHIAAAVGCPVLAIFGPTNPKRFLPRGPGRVELLLGSAPCQFCHGTATFRSCTDNICLNRLEPGAIRAAWRRLLSPAAPLPPPAAGTLPS